MLGNEENARFIRDWYVDVKAAERASRMAWGEWIDLIPEGWEYISRGVSRAAFLGPGEVIYKVEHAYTRDYWAQSNSGEAEALRKHQLTKLPRGCRLPRFTYYELDGRGVMVMEYFAKLLESIPRYSPERNKHESVLPRLRSVTGLDDLYGTNLAIDTENDLVVPIDLGC